MAPCRVEFKELEFESALDSSLEILSSVKVILLRMIILCISPLVSHDGYKWIQSDNNLEDTYSNLIELHALVFFYKILVQNRAVTNISVLILRFRDSLLSVEQNSVLPIIFTTL